MKTVIISPVLPHPHPDNAGEHYLLHLYRALGPEDTIFITPTTPRSLAAAQAGAPAHILVPTAAGTRRSLRRQIRDTWAKVFTVTPAPGFADALRRSPSARRALAAADIVDVQWENSQALIPLLRTLAPHARFVLTFHDVVSQQKARERAAAHTLRERIKASASLSQAQGLERRSHEVADEIVVLSEKDRAILPRPDRASIVYPPIADGIAAVADPLTHADSRPQNVMFVGPLWREPNREAVNWLIDDVWPIVRRAAPEAQLLIAGTLPDVIEPLVSHGPGVTYLGFVDDLDGLYAQTSVLAAPLRKGAGVKFKVVEAIARGVPTALTSVAAEGIGDATFTPRSDDSAEGFAAQVIDALRDPAQARTRAAEAAAWARHRYGWDQFARRVQAVYGPVDTTHDSVDVSTPLVPRPPITVVIPARDGAATLPDQLDAIGAEPEAAQIEIIVSDNGSRDRTVAVARAYASLFGALRVIDSSAVAGVGPARNAGAWAAQADRVVFLDTDDEIRPGFIGEICRALDTADAAAGLPITGRLGPADAEGVTPQGPLRRTPYGPLEYGVGCVLSVRTEVLRELGGFDESFHEGHEEVEFCWRLQLADRTLVGVPEAMIDYRQRPTARSAFRQFRRYARSGEHLRSRYVTSLGLAGRSPARSLKLLARTIVRVPRAVARGGIIEVSRSLGWAVGSLEGSLKYPDR